MKQFYYDDTPLIFDDNYERKPAYYAFRDAIATLAVGGTVGGNVDLENDKLWGDGWIPKQKGVENTKANGDSRPDWLQS